MWNLAIPWWEFIVRALLVYIFLVVLLLVMSNAVQNSMNGGDNSVLRGVLSAMTLVAASWVIGYLTFRSKRLARVIEGRPQIVIHNGHVYRDVMDRERLTQAELDTALREAGCASIEDVHFAVLENNGRISVRVKADRGRPVVGTA